MLPFINPAPILFSLATLFGVLVHDMHIDHATTVAVALPAIMASTGTVSTMLRSSEHIHVERASFPRYSSPMRSSLPKVQPPRDDLRKYVQNKKVTFISGGQDYVWPSV